MHYVQVVIVHVGCRLCVTQFLVFMMSAKNYSCFDVPVDLSLTGSQVSPTRKLKPTSAR